MRIPPSTVTVCESKVVKSLKEEGDLEEVTHTFSSFSLAEKMPSHETVRVEKIFVYPIKSCAAVEV